MKIQGLKFSNILLHISLWIFVLIFPILFNESDKPHPPLNENITDLFFAIIIFYLNYFFFIRNFLFRKNFLIFLILNILIITAFIAVNYIISIYLKDIYSVDIGASFNNSKPIPPEIRGHGGDFRKKIPFDLFIFRNVAILLLSIGISVAIRSTVRFKKEEALREQAEKERLISELTYLKYQLQPHFFFNTLNNIYALIDRKPEMAKDVLLKLSKLMRYVLYHAEDAFVPLAGEIVFLKNYIELMSIRIPQNFPVETVFESEKIENIKVPPLLFITLLENAYKHGIINTDGGFIDVQLLIKAGKIHFIARNSYDPASASDLSASGIGLENLNKRLNLIFSESEFQLNKHISENEYNIELIIPCK